MNGLGGINSTSSPLDCYFDGSFTKFVTLKSQLIQMHVSSLHPYQPLVLISTAQCITGLRRKKVFCKTLLK